MVGVLEVVWLIPSIEESEKTYSLINSTAPSYLSPNSINANATSTGARPKPATQCTATHASEVSLNLRVRGNFQKFLISLSTQFPANFKCAHFVLNISNHSSTMLGGGKVPSS